MVHSEKMKQILTEEMVKKYGIPEGLRKGNTVIPSILNDFDNELKAASVGHEISEIYKLDDQSAEVQLSGLRNASGKREITRLMIDGKEISIP